MKFAELLKQLNVPVAPSEHHHAREGWVQFDCPYCGQGSHKYHMGYSTSRRYVNCWRCGPKRLKDTLLRLGVQNQRDVARFLAGLDPEKVSQRRFEAGILKIPAKVGPLQQAHLKYLRGRGFVPERIETLWGVRGIGLAARLQWRLWIPIYLDGEVVSWTTRSIGENGLRYVSAGPDEEVLNHKDILYGEDYVRSSTVAIFEGPTDVWKFGPGGVATLGTGWNSQQLARLSKYQTRVVCFDNEVQAQQRARRLVDSLQAFDGETCNLTFDGKDLGSCEQWEARLFRKRVLQL